MNGSKSHQRRIYKEAERYRMKKEKKEKKKEKKEKKTNKNKQKTEMPLWKRIDPTRKQNKNNKRNKMKQNETTKDYAKKLKIECTEDFL